jgi:hypothetical protein
VLLLAALAANVHATEVKITASDGAAYDYFGVSVAISGDYAVAGAHCDDDAGMDSGSAYIFKRDGTAWTEQAKIAKQMRHCRQCRADAIGRLGEDVQEKYYQ